MTQWATSGFEGMLDRWQSFITGDLIDNSTRLCTSTCPYLLVHVSCSSFSCPSVWSGIMGGLPCGDDKK